MSETGEKLFCLNVKLCIKPERREEFLANIANNQKGTTTTEPLAVTYLWGEDESTPNTFHFFEQYKGREGFEAHQKAPNARGMMPGAMRKHNCEVFPVRQFAHTSFLSILFDNDLTIQGVPSTKQWHIRHKILKVMGCLGTCLLTGGP